MTLGDARKLAQLVIERDAIQLQINKLQHNHPSWRDLADARTLIAQEIDRLIRASRKARA